MDRFVETKLSGALIPILKPLDVECTLYMLRLTPLERYERTDIEMWLNTFTENWVCAKENSKKAKLHFHITIFDSFEEETLREKIRSFLLSKFPEPPKRGDANKQYNLTVAESVDKAINYTVKELDITYGTGMDPEYMKLRLKASFIKFDKHTFAKELEDLKQLYKTTDKMKIGEFMERFVLLKASYRQPINMNYIYQLAISCHVNKDNSQAEMYVRAFLENKNI